MERDLELEQAEEVLRVLTLSSCECGGTFEPAYLTAVDLLPDTVPSEAGDEHVHIYYCQSCGRCSFRQDGFNVEIRNGVWHKISS